MAVREALWDCQYCDAMGVRGREDYCPSCSRPRPEGTKFYLPKDAQAVTDESLLRQTKKGPDWVCAFCDSSNEADETACVYCGAGREATSAQQQVKEYAVGSAPTSGDNTFEDAPVAAEPQQASRPRWLPVAGVLALLVLLACICGGILLSRSSEAEVTAVQFDWQRTIEVEAVRTVVEEDWDVPAGGRTLSQQEEIREYDRVLIGYETLEREVSEQVQVGERTYVCGQRDLGNGFFEDIECTDPVYETQYRTESYDEPIYESVPVYGTKYTYEIDRWLTVRTEQAGANDRSPLWPNTNLGEGEREGDRTEMYQITFQDGEGTRHTLDYTEAEWQTFEQGTTYQLKFNAFGEPVEIIRE